MSYFIENHYPLFKEEKINSFIKENIAIALSLKEGEYHKNVYNNDFFVISQNTLLRSSQECVYESYKQYVDIHHVISGGEKIELLNLKDVESDFYLHKSEVSPIEIVLAGDNLVIFDFDDVHKVGIQFLENVKYVVKIVIKMKKNLFDKEFIYD